MKQLNVIVFFFFCLALQAQSQVETEHFDIGLRKFKRACEKAAIVPEIRAREFYEKPTEKRKRLMAAAVKRARKSNRKFSFSRSRFR